MQEDLNYFFDSVRATQTKTPLLVYKNKAFETHYHGVLERLISKVPMPVGMLLDEGIELSKSVAKLPELTVGRITHKKVPAATLLCHESMALWIVCPAKNAPHVTFLITDQPMIKHTATLIMALWDTAHSEPSTSRGEKVKSKEEMA